MKENIKEDEMKIAASMLACDFSRAGEELKLVANAGADLIHLDVMDGSFVPNISFGADIIKSLRRYTCLPFDVHLMIENPIRYIKEFSDSGADIITFHLEATEGKSDVENTIRTIKSFGVLPGISVKPQTPISAVFPYLNDLYMVLIMTVNPGFGGQSFMHSQVEKIKELNEEIVRLNLHTVVQVDGGINKDTIAYVACADICVAGTAIFKSHDYKQAISELKSVNGY